MKTSVHSQFMKKAIELAYLGKWQTAPNPCVGAVLVYNGEIIASGYHKAYGQAHAEVECLLNALELGVTKDNNLPFSNLALENKYRENSGNRQELTFSKCTLYVTLEPCNHVGKTPPCSKAIYESGIKKVVVGMKDPNHKATGGLEFLKNHGIEVEVNVLKEECESLLEDFLVWQKKKRPFVILKMATTLDGKIGPSFGGNHRISGDKSREVLMELRKNIGLAGGGILVGANTFIKDNPKLDARTINVVKEPRAIILSSNLLLEKAKHSKFHCFENRINQTILYCSFTQSDLQIVKALEERGINLVKIAQEKETNRLNLKALLEDLYKNQDCPYVLCEGGAILGLSLLEQGLVDKLILYVAPKILGNSEMQSVFSGRNITDVAEALNFQIEQTKMAGEDLHLFLKPIFKV